MSRHEFRLRAVLRARKRALDSAQGHLANELREKDRDQREREHLLAQLHETSSELHDRLTLGASAATLQSVAGAIEVAHSGAQLAALRADSRDAAIDDARRAITTARKDLRGLEILEANWTAKQRREAAKRDQNRLDEIATRGRRRMSQ